MVYVKRAVSYWLWAVILIFVLYVVISVLFFNHAGPAILGMPPMLFWFTVVPLVTPLILGTLYLIDRRINPQWDEEGYDVRS